MNFAQFNPSLPMDDSENIRYAKSRGWKIKTMPDGTVEYIKQNDVVITDILAAIEATMYDMAFCTPEMEGDSLD